MVELNIDRAYSLYKSDGSQGSCSCGCVEFSKVGDSSLTRGMYKCVSCGQWWRVSEPWFVRIVRVDGVLSSMKDFGSR